MKNKPLLLVVTADLTEGIVNGKRLRVRSVVKPIQRDSRQDVREQTPGPKAAAEHERDLKEERLIQKVLSRDELKALKACKGWPHFKDVFMMCATDSEDVQTLKVNIICIYYIKVSN